MLRFGAEQGTTIEEAPPKPRGVGIAVAFDWSAAALFAGALILEVVRRGTDRQNIAALALLTLLIAPPMLLLGEALRRGDGRARPLQIGLSGLAVLFNAFGLIKDLLVLADGTLPRSTNLPSLLAGLWIIWGLTRPQTAHWFAQITPARARRQHGGAWLVLTGLASAVVGIAAALINRG